LNIKDVNIGIKVIKRNVLNKINLSSTGSFINVEFLSEARRQGYLIKEINCHYHKRIYGYSKMGNFKNIFKIIIEMSKYYSNLKT